MEAEKYLLNKQWITKEVKEEIKYLETNDCKNMTVQNLRCCCC